MMHQELEGHHTPYRWAPAAFALLVGAFLALALAWGARLLPARPLEPSGIEPARGGEAVRAIIRIECRHSGVSADFALCVAQRESGLDPGAIGDHGEAVGLYQFHPGTWRRFRAEMGLPLDDLRADARESARTACWAFANGYTRRWIVVRRGLCRPD